MNTTEIGAADLGIFILKWGSIGSLILAAYLIFAWQQGLLGAVRNEAGELRRHLPRAGVMTGIGSVLMYIVLIAVADVQDLLSVDASVPFTRLLANNYLVYIFWLLFDTLVIDILVVTLWHPTFVRLPDREAHGSVIYHLRTIPRGLMLGVPVVLTATGIVWFFVR